MGPALAAILMVASGMGVGVLPIEAVEPQLAFLPIVAAPIADAWTLRTHRLATREGVQPAAATKSLMQALQQPV